MSKLTDFLTGGSDEPKELEGEEEFYTTSKEEFHNTNGMAGSRMMLLEPRAYSESQQIADYLKNRSAVVVNLKRVTPDQAKRIIDFFEVLINSSGKMILLEPRAFSESQQIADHLKKRNTVVVNMKRVTSEQAKRIIDFLSGTIYAIGGQLQKLGGGIFLATPNNYNIEGTITDEKAEKVARNGNGKKASDDEADFF